VQRIWKNFWANCAGRWPRRPIKIAAAASEQERTGIFTTSIISKTGQRQIALFFTGQKHAGENLNQLLQRRAAGLDQPMQMCDALSRNEPKEFHTLLCHCLLHGRRQFVDVVENFPEECRKVIESLREVYRFDVVNLNPQCFDLLGWSVTTWTGLQNRGAAGGLPYSKISVANDGKEYKKKMKLFCGRNQICS